MKDTNETVEHLRKEVRQRMEVLRTERDELRVRVHLAKAEVREEWDKVEAKWEHFQGKAHAVGQSAGDAAKDLSAAATLLGEEIKNAYRRIRDSIER